MKKLISSTSVTELKAIQAYLESNNIETWINNEHQSNTPGAPSAWLEVKAELWAKEDYMYTEAMKQIQKYCIELEENRKKVDSIWDCDKCNEENPGTFELCWSCGDPA